MAGQIIKTCSRCGKSGGARLGYGGTMKYVDLITIRSGYVSFSGYEFKQNVKNTFCRSCAEIVKNKRKNR